MLCNYTALIVVNMHYTMMCRTAAEIAREQNVDMASLKDPQEDKDRVQGDPKW